LGSFGIPGAPRISGSLRVASLLGTQLQSPSRGLSRAHNQLIQRRNRHSGIEPFRYASSRALRGNACFAADPAQARKPNGRFFVPDGLHISGGGEAHASKQSFQGCNNLDAPPKTTQI
jgi:hypothetical protein